MSGKIFFTWHLDFLPRFRFLIKYKTVSAIMHLLFLQIATQKISLLVGELSVGLRVRHLAFIPSFFLRFILFYDYSAINDISLLLFLQFARQVSWWRLTNYLALSLLLIAFLYESWNLTFISVQIAMHISFVRKKDVYCYSLLSPWGLESRVKLNRNFYVCFWISVLM